MIVGFVEERRRFRVEIRQLLIDVFYRVVEGENVRSASGLVARS